jgi:methylase of polypeptide subunit release factors
MSVFERNLTSVLLENSLRNHIKRMPHPINILEIGCGDGNITRTIASEYINNKYYASDISSEAIEKAKSICNKKIDSIIEFKVSHGFDAWTGIKFDVILCDISAINQKIAELSDWYKGVECSTGDDGLDAIRPIVQNARNYLNSDGILILPTISLSNTAKLDELLKENFRSISIVQSKDWPMPVSLSAAIRKEKIPNKGINWNTKNKFGLEIANTGVLSCKI